MSSHGKIDVNANTHDVKQTVAKKAVRSQVKAFAVATGITIAQKKASIKEYLSKQKGLTFKFEGDTVRIKTLGEYASEYIFTLK